MCEGAGLADAGFDSCLYDYCAYGGDAQWGNISRVTDAIDAQLAPKRRKAAHAAEKGEEEEQEEEEAEEEDICPDIF